MFFTDKEKEAITVDLKHIIDKVDLSEEQKEIRRSIIYKLNNPPVIIEKIVKDDIGLRKCVYDLSDSAKGNWSSEHYFHKWFNESLGKHGDMPKALIENCTTGEMTSVRNYKLKFLDKPNEHH